MAQKSLSCNIALCSSKEIIKKSIRVSRALKKKGSVFALDDKNYYPHVTIYMTEFPRRNISLVARILEQVANNAKSLSLKAVGYKQSKGRGYVDVEYKRTQELDNLQKKIVKALNAARDGLIPGFLQKKLSKLEGWRQKNLKKYGYDNVGRRFRPHITLGKLPGNKGDTDVLQDLPRFNFDCKAQTIVLFRSGKYAAARRVIRKFKLGK